MEMHDMNKEIRAVIGTNAWGDAIYRKLLRGSYVEEDIIRKAAQTEKSSGGHVLCCFQRHRSDLR